MSKTKTSEEEITTCSECGCIIEPDEERYRCTDNFMQVKFFEDPDLNIFCSEECFCRYLGLEFYVNEAMEKESGW